jgi:hypothetical protein
MKTALAQINYNESDKRMKCYAFAVDVDITLAWKKNVEHISPPTG